jgi:saccharopine dehydrogenase-like NADP-dependent oxidoreductase
LSDPSNIYNVVCDADIVVNAVPGHMGYKTLEHIIRAKKDVVDIAFYSEDPLQLHQLAVDNGVTAIVDMGVAPGMSHAFLGHHISTMSAVEDYECLVGGLPKEKTWPFYYKAPFSPSDVIQEYLRPARLMENGYIITKPAMSDRELVEFPNIGTLEAFNTDGLRTALHTCTSVPNIREKTLRYPGHIDLMFMLKQIGFFDESKLKQCQVSPLDFTSELLFDQWKLEPTDKEFTVMRITVKGRIMGQEEKHIWNLFDEGDSLNSSMARTTGYACTAAVHLLNDGLYTGKGIIPPEHVGANKACFDFLLAYQATRGIKYQHITVRQK